MEQKEKEEFEATTIILSEQRGAITEYLEKLNFVTNAKNQRKQLIINTKHENESKYYQFINELKGEFIIDQIKTKENNQSKDLLTNTKEKFFVK